MNAQLGHLASTSDSTAATWINTPNLGDGHTEISNADYGTLMAYRLNHLGPVV
jgi:hypothetical protein